jgi:hypothetical protein
MWGSDHGELNHLLQDASTDRPKKTHRRMQCCHCAFGKRQHEQLVVGDVPSRRLRWSGQEEELKISRPPKLATPSRTWVVCISRSSCKTKKTTQLDFDTIPWNNLRTWFRASLFQRLSPNRNKSVVGQRPTKPRIHLSPRRLAHVHQKSCICMDVWTSVARKTGNR